MMHVITGLGVGGAERALFNLLSRLPAESARETSVVSLTTMGAFGRRFEEIGIQVIALEMTKKPISWRSLWRWRTLIGSHRPDVLMAWMYHANVASWLVTRWMRCSPALIWNIRHSLYAITDEKPLTRWVIRLHRWLSGSARAIVFNSRLALRQHEQFGITSEHSLVISNGFDLVRWCPDLAVGQQLRREHSIPVGAIVVGHVARFHVIKDQVTLLSAMREVMHQCLSVHLVLVGRDLDQTNPALRLHLEALPGDRLHVLGERDDVHRLMTMMDIFCLSSRSEAFPNVLGEAMASGIVCVTTDVGDARDLLGDIGCVIPVSDPGALKSAVLTLVAKGSEELQVLGQQARNRIEQHYTLEGTVAAYQRLLNDVLA